MTPGFKWKGQFFFLGMPPLIATSTASPGTQQPIKQMDSYHKAGGFIHTFWMLPRLLQNPHESFTSESQQKCTELVTVTLSPICTLVSIGELKKYAHTHTHRYILVYIMSGPHPRSIKSETLGMVLNNILLIVLAKEQPGLKTIS